MIEKYWISFLILCFVAVNLCHGQTTFHYTGSVQTYKVPVNISSLTITACGASGYASSSSYRGYGMCITSQNIPAISGEILYVYVGGVGKLGSSGGGYNGGGNAYPSDASVSGGGGGGGASDVRNGTSLGDRMIVGGGGGGFGITTSTSGSTYSYDGGNAGCVIGNDGYGSGGGNGGAQTYGGAGGYYSTSYYSGGAGSYGQGGAAGDFTGGGGGGGGWYGGGGGSYNGGGGGGSSHSLWPTTCTTNSDSNNGYVTITAIVEYSKEFSYTGSPQYFNVPTGTTSLTIQAIGAQGGSTSVGRGGYGANIQSVTTSSYSITSIQNLQIIIGGVSGYPDGGKPYSTSCATGGNGGGSTTILYKSTYSSSYYSFLIAAGGGGAGYDPACTFCNSTAINGGNAGYLTTLAGAGLGSPAQAGSYGGKGATSSGGKGGYYSSSYLTGGYGGSDIGGAPATGTCGGGGGGGNYGGGGGAFTGGGGGSSYTTTSYGTVSALPNTNTGNGKVIITYLAPLSSSSSSSVSTLGAGAITGIFFSICCFCVCCCYCCYAINNENSTPSPSKPAAAPQTVVYMNPVVANRSPTKIQSAVSVMRMFLQSMMSRNDRCSIVSFSTTYKIRTNLGTESQALSELNSCLRGVGGGTALYDAAVVSVLQFVATADKSRPWILLILTDGEDTDSKTSSSQMQEALTAFNKAASNFVFVIGLGKTIKDQALRSICSSSGSLYFRAEDLETMQLLFAIIAIQVVERTQTQIAAIRAEGVEAVLARVQKQRALVQTPMDMLILLDTSGSMDEQA